LSSEEEAFNEYKYPKAKDHIEAHKGYRLKIGDLYNKSRKAESSQIIPLTREVVDFATDWLMTHILSMDKEYTSFLKDKVNNI
jgi:hemerythrin-like metal-binding protein